jgi:hypothetical protein
LRTDDWLISTILLEINQLEAEWLQRNVNALQRGSSPAQPIALSANSV